MRINISGKAIASLGVTGIILWLSFVLGVLSISIYGLFLAFSASIVLGIVTLFVEPLPLLIGALKLFAHIDLAHKIVEFFNK